MKVIYHEEDFDKRPEACYLLKYRGVSYWSCYKINLITWLEKMATITRED